MKLHIIAAIKNFLKQECVSDPDQYAEKCVIVMGTQIALTKDSLARDMFTESLLSSVLMEDFETVKSLVKDETAVKKLFCALDIMYEKVFKTYLDLSEIQDIKDRVTSAVK